jgi:3-deoxy-D-manno-octulosonic-acid transferase
MYLLYSLLLTIGFFLMSPLFFLRREKYAAGFSQRLGNYPEFKHDERPVIWLHCVSVGETNAARPLVDELHRSFPSHRIVISTTTKTGQELAERIFADKTDAVFYFPFDWKFSVNRALETFKPRVVLLMETEIWPRLIRETHLSGASVAIVNGRLSERSFKRYLYVKGFVRNVLGFVDMALMQGEKDASRIDQLGLGSAKIFVTGNLKFDQNLSSDEKELTRVFRERFGIDGTKPLIVAASTHEPEERWIMESLDGELGHSCRLLIAPRHPERFDDVADLLHDSPYSFVKRTREITGQDKEADIILLDSIGELRAVYPLAEIVFVGGSLIPHGGQSILEPASLGKPIVTGPHTMNFDAAVSEFLENDALIQLPESRHEYEITERLYEALVNALLQDAEQRQTLGHNASAVMGLSNNLATEKTIKQLKQMVYPTDKVKTEK